METIIGIKEQQRQHSATAGDGVSTLESIEARIAEFRSRSAELATERSLYLDDRQRFSAETMKRPVSTKASYSIFGALIGSIPTFSIGLRILFEEPRGSGAVFFTLFTLAAVVTGLVGAITGPYAAQFVERARGLRASAYVTALPFIGMAWGAASGAIGGVFLFIVGAIFGGITGAMVGFTLVPLFVLLHGVLRQGDRIEFSHLLPISLGIAGTLAASILGL
ncbi:MAG TPA: hypothetical protein VK918_02140 [Pyrinomonadaceae bacterium]|nr:hypothetical protein [Pyrinomonadaceae bacterium]